MKDVNQFFQSKKSHNRHNRKSSQNSSESSHVEPYQIPKQSIFYRKTYQEQSQQSTIFANVRTQFQRWENDNEQLFNQKKIPQIPNKLNLILPSKGKKTKIFRLQGQQRENYQNTNNFLHKIFSCCLTPQEQLNYEDCDYCDRRVYFDQKQGQFYTEQEKRIIKEQQTAPYMSQNRKQVRQKQPINVFYQEITNQKILNNRYQTIRKI